MNILYSTLFGSKLYGTDSELSDNDYKTIYLPTLDECVTQKIKNTIQNKTTEYEEEIFSLQYFLKLACEGQSCCIDMVHSKDWIVTSDIWKELYKNRSRFYTKTMPAYFGYCRQQAHKYKDATKRLNVLKTILECLKQHLTITP